MHLKVGQVINTKTLKYDIEQIQAYYKRKGFSVELNEEEVDIHDGVLIIPLSVRENRSLPQL